MSVPLVDPAALTKRDIRRVAIAGFIGTAVEWYDFFIYGSAAALVFAGQFFPGFSPLAGTLAAFATFAVGFAARPLGGIVLAHFGDRIGRKRILVLTLLMMGLATTLIGVLPTFAQVGILAPVLLVLLRVVQGLGVGGEWGGAALMAVEHAPPDRRGFYGGFVQMGVPAGIILSNGVFFLVSALLSPAQFAAWGWRIPFLLSAVLVLFGLFVRGRITESPVFTELRANRRRSRMPLLEVLRNHPKQVLIAAGTFVGNSTIGYLFMVYTLSYGTQQLKVSRNTLLLLVFLASALWLSTIPAFSAWSDRVGRRRVYLVGSVLIVAWAFPYFILLDTADPVWMLVAVLVMAIAMSLSYAPQAALYAEMFEPPVRYSGASLAYQLGAIFGGGIAPFVATAIYGATRSSAAVAGYVLAVGLVSLLAVLALRERRTDRSSDDRTMIGSSEAGR